MRLILPTISLVVLAASAWIAPSVRSDRLGSSGSPTFGIADPVERARQGEDANALGLILRGYEETLKSNPNDAKAAMGFVRAAVVLSAVSLGQRDVGPVIKAAAKIYAENAGKVDPDGERLDAALQEWIALRMASPRFLAHASINIWMASRGDPTSQANLQSYLNKGPFWQEYFPYCQQNLPTWVGVEPVVRTCLESGDLGARIVAGVTLMVYRRIYGLGEELWQTHKRSIGDALIEGKSAMSPDPDIRDARSVGGQILLGLALYGDPTTQRIVAKLRPIDHPYLGRIVTTAQCWSGAKPFESIDFQDKRYSVWYPATRETYYRGVMLEYARLVAENKTEAAKRLYDSRVELALISGNTQIRIFAHRVLAAVHPDRSVALHRELVQTGGIPAAYGVHGVPGTSLSTVLLPGLEASDPGFSTLVVVGLLKIDAPPPIQMPIARD